MDRERGRAPRRAGVTPPRAHAARRQPLDTARSRRPTVRAPHRPRRARRSTIASSARAAARSGCRSALDGLAVRAPRWATIRDIEATLREHAAWILRTLAEWRARRRDVLPREWKSGAPILFQGRELTLALHRRARGRSRPICSTSPCYHPSPHDEQAIAAFVVRWLQATRRCASWCRASPRSPRGSRASTPTVKLSNARSEWGSCNHKGEIRFYWRLDPAAARARRLRRRARGRAPGRAQSLGAVLGAGRDAFPGHAAARRALGDWTALLEESERRRASSAVAPNRSCVVRGPASAGSATSILACACSNARERRSELVAASACRATRRRAARSESRRVRAATQSSRFGHVPVDDELAAVAALDLEDSVVERPVDVDVGPAASAVSSAFRSPRACGRRRR